MTRIAVLVPAFNEEANIKSVVRELRQHARGVEVIVIDDGSWDATAERARTAGARVIQLPFNTGIGATVQTGLRVALALGHELVVRIDGDGQHDSRDLDRLLTPIERGEADFVLGSRHLADGGFRTTLPRRLGIRWFSFLLRTFCGLRITDPTSGFWAANPRAARLLLAESASDYPEVDSLVYLSRRGCCIEERPVTMRPRGAGRSSIEGLHTLYYMLKVSVALLAGRLRRRTPREDPR
ncbi:MAG: glycosyltransferase family 2 protein [Myxococcota bacterium]